ncbi:MAG: ABC transporter permease [Planctomycetales bacterium]|nr:ABC transporter permease [Planctomycetales bacterium]
MYRLLLAWRYLLTRYIALASIISVTLGVATLVIVNSVMAGFAREMEARLNGILSDLVIEAHSLLGIPEVEEKKRIIREVLGDDVVGITATVHVPSMMNFDVNGTYMNRQITLIGIDTETYAQVSDFGRHLLHPDNQKQIGFDLKEGGYAPGRDGFPLFAGWERRRMNAEMAAMRQKIEDAQRRLNGDQLPPADPTAVAPPADPLAGNLPADPVAEDPAHPGIEQHTGIILGIAMCTLRQADPSGKVRDLYLLQPGDDVQITYPKCSIPVQPERAVFTVVDFYESKMSEYDSNFAFMPLEELQRLRVMFDEETQSRTVSSLQIKLRDGADLDAARDKLQARFPVAKYRYSIRTWRDSQGPLLAAVQLETTILNILLFLIIAVAGFGILATFFMIVVEKTKDIGVLKALGAPSSGVMSIFLSYGLSLGLVGSGVGAALGLVFVRHINPIADFLEWVTGRPVFDPTIYYFTEIPVHVEPLMIAMVILGSLGIAVLASVLPAMRAARLHPVEALRYE